MSKIQMKRVKLENRIETKQKGHAPPISRTIPIEYGILHLTQLQSNTKWESGKTIFSV